jgi:hypothetical protein
MRLAKVVFAAVALAGASSSAQDKTRVKPDTITPERFERLHRIIRPHADEWKWAQIPWVLTITEARKKAAQEGKPVFIWTMAGEPLGQC